MLRQPYSFYQLLIFTPPTLQTLSLELKTLRKKIKDGYPGPNLVWCFEDISISAQDTHIPLAWADGRRYLACSPETECLMELDYTFVELDASSYIRAIDRNIIDNTQTRSLSTEQSCTNFYLSLDAVTCSKDTYLQSTSRPPTHLSCPKIELERRI